MLLIVSGVLSCVGCSSVKKNQTKSSKPQVVTLNDVKQNTPTFFKELNKNDNDHILIIERYKVNFPPQLISYMEGALKNNKKIAEAQHDVLATNEQHNIQKSAFKPVIDSVSGISNRPTRHWQNMSTSDVTVAAETAYSTSLRMRWNLFKGGADIAKLESTDKQIEAKWKEYDTVVQDVLQQVAELYFNIVSKQKEIENIRSLMNARKESINVASQMNIAGVAKEVDVAQANAAYAESEAKLSVAEAQEQTYMTQLSEITGLPVSGKLQQPKNLTSATDAMKMLTEKKALEIASKLNPKVIASNAKCLAAQAEMKEPVDGFSPSLDLESGFYAEQDHDVNGVIGKSGSMSTTNVLYRHNPAIGLSLTIPIYSGGGGKAKKRQMGENLTKARIARDRTLLELKTELKRSFEMIEAANENIISGEQAITARSMSLQATKDELQAGIKIMKDVLDEQQKLFEAQQMLTEAVKDKLINQCKLLSCLGLLNPKYLKLEDPGFDYKKEFEHQKRGLFTRFSERKANKKLNDKYFSE